ncbi:MAG: DUF169 domain-containing protein [Candidatus Bathyarchaeota archaeon]|nr:DUF169 domain-containing protein [Candidatus Bathyarchaeota archaeon]
MSHPSRAEIHASLVTNLDSDSPPIGISLLKSDLPEDIERPARQRAFCEVIALSRREGRVIGITKDDIDCPFALEALGLKNLSWERVTEIAASKQFGPHTIEFITTFPMIAKSGCNSIVIGPLEDLPSNPDVVLIHGYADKILKLVNAWIWMRGKPINVGFQGIGGICSESVAAAYNKGGPTICALPCKGSIQLGKLEDGVMIFASPYNLLEELIEGLREIELPPEDAESFIMKLLGNKGRMTTRAITRELLMFIPRCPDYPAQLLARMRSNGKIKSKLSPKDKGLVWLIT